MLARGGVSPEYGRRMDACLGNLIPKLDGIRISNEGDDASSRESYFQVLKAIEEAECTLQAQERENDRLRSELQATKQERDNYERENDRLRSEQATKREVENHEKENDLLRSELEATTWEVQNYELAPKVREREEEIIQLRKHIADYAMKEAPIRNEKCLLEKKISYMRTAFDQQQQDLVDAASKSLSYHQDIIKENIRLTYALQVAEQERTIFVTSLLPLLAEYDLQPHVGDAQSIVTNLKILIQHLREMVNLSENKLKESQYPLVPWRAGHLSNPSIPPQSPSHLRPDVDVMPQSTPVSSPISLGSLNHWEGSENHRHQLGSEHLLPKSMEHNHQGPSSFGSSYKSTAANNILSRPGAEVPAVALQQSDNYIGKSVFNGSVADTARESANLFVIQNEKETPMHFSSGNPPIATSAMEDPASAYSPYLPPEFEEPSSSCSEAVEDDPLPAIKGLQIIGEPIPGEEIQACGHSVNGTTTCNFAWIREAEDGSVTYITGANQPSYMVTADDVDSRLAIEIIPMDDQRRKGELIREFANEKRKITCDHTMQQEIKKSLSAGHALFSVSLASTYMGGWESAVLNVKNHGYTIKYNESRTTISEKFSDAVAIMIPYGHATEFFIEVRSEQGPILRAVNSQQRDLIVLTFRLFKKRAVQFKRKGKKKVLFFNKLGS